MIPIIQNRIFSKKRTTIYLPKNIPIHHPTQDIQTILVRLPELVAIISNRTNFIDFYKDYIYPLLNVVNSDSKSYQIVLDEKILSLIDECKLKSGLSQSLITQLCYFLTKVDPKMRLFKK
jgi:hypothetical protein